MLDETTKKEFQKVIGAIRKNDAHLGDYPKAMMTDKQMFKGTATVNCGEFIYHENSMGLAKSVMENNLFQSFLTKHNATAHVEAVERGYQIRINFK